MQPTVIGKIWRYTTGRDRHVLPVRANRIEKSDADFALFAHVTRSRVVPRDKSENVKKALVRRKKGQRGLEQIIRCNDDPRSDGRTGKPHEFK